MLDQFSESQGATANIKGAEHEQATLDRILSNYPDPPLKLENKDATEHWQQVKDSAQTGLIRLRPRHTILIEAKGVVKNFLGRDTHSDMCIIRTDGSIVLVECKTQSKGGSAGLIEKFPYILDKMLSAPAIVTHRVIVLEGVKGRQYLGHTLINAAMLDKSLSRSGREALLSGAVKILSLQEFADWHRAFIWPAD